MDAEGQHDGQGNVSVDRFTPPLTDSRVRREVLVGVDVYMCTCGYFIHIYSLSLHRTQVSIKPQLLVRKKMTLPS